MKFQYVAYWNELLTYMIGWLVFLATIKFLRLLRFNRRISVLASTLRNGAKPLASYLIVFLTTFFAFVALFSGLFGSNVLDYSTVVYTAETLLSMTLGKFDFYILQRTNPLFGPFLFFVYICSITFIMLNMFISILNESFSAVQSDRSLQNNDYEIVDYMMNKLKAFFGKETPNRDHTGLAQQFKVPENEHREAAELVGVSSGAREPPGNPALESGAETISRFLNKLTMMHTGETPVPMEKFRINWSGDNEADLKAQFKKLERQAFGKGYE